MGLINLRTNLKDLKFGNDRPGSGNSGQPFIQTRIPATEEPLQTGISNAGPVLASLGAGAAIGAIGGSILGSTGVGAVVGAGVGLGLGIAGSNLTTSGFRLPSAGTGGTDFLLRGGTLLPNALVDDAVRLTKFFKSTEGVLFAVKQNLLSRVGVRTQGAPVLLNERIYTPISTLLGAVGSPLGLYVNKQGLNPLLGLGDIFVPDRYITAIGDNINQTNNFPSAILGNRLYALYDTSIVSNNTLNNFGFSRGTSLNEGASVISYSGGPGAPLGIGKTNIKYATDNTGLAPLRTWSKNSNINEEDGNSFVTLSNEQLNEISGRDGIGDYKRPVVVDFRQKIKNKLTDLGLSTNSPAYDRFNIEQRVKIGDPGGNVYKPESYTDGDITVKVKDENGNVQDGGGKGAASPSSYDILNASGVISKKITDNKAAETHPDLVTFKIEVFKLGGEITKQVIYFRAFLDQISDTYNSNWDPTRYIGRGENFYTYAGFDRKISLGWTVAAQSKIELLQMYRRLNYLASVCAPDYDAKGFMKGNIITLTIGGYIFEQKGIVNGFSFEMNEENDTWEIAIDDKGDEDVSSKQLPHLIRVRGFNFTPIHDFVPKLQKYDVDSDGTQTYGPERYIALRNGSGNDNWGMDSYTYTPPISTPRFL